MNCLKGLCLRPTQNGHIVPHNLTRKGPREFVPPGSFFVFPSGIRPGLAGVFQLSAPFLEVSGRGEGDMGELQNQWHKCRVFVGMKTSEAIPPHLSLIVHSIMTRKESKVIVMIALGSLFFWRQRDQENPFGLHFFIFRGILELQDTPLSGSAQMVRIGRTSGRGLRGTISRSRRKGQTHSVCLFLPFSPSDCP